jgi:hypothetical protein
MPENHRTEAYKRLVTPVERFFTRSPFSIVTMVARIRGNVTESMIRAAEGQKT